MARKPRVHYEGALYHVMSRGNQGQRIFKDNSDRERYVALLKESRQRYDYRLYAYVLMDNHVHHLIEVGRTPLSKIMQNLLFRFTRYWNRRYRQVGHLFQGRYKAILCQKDSYLLELIRYIHLNPVRSKIVKDPKYYAWSSHRAYLYLKKEEPGWIAVEEVLSYWGKHRAQAVSAYQCFIRGGIREGHRADLYEIVDQRYLGNEAFVERVEKRMTVPGPAPKVEVRWKEIQDAVCGAFGISLPEVMHRGRGRRIVQIRRMMAWVGREVSGMSNQMMAVELGQDPAVLSRGLSQLAGEMAENRGLRRVAQGLCEGLRKGRNLKRSIRSA